MFFFLLSLSFSVSFFVLAAMPSIYNIIDRTIKQVRMLFLLLSFLLLIPSVPRAPADDKKIAVVF